LLLRLISNY